MSDTPQGDGWWQTSDGKWHPPEYDPTVPGSDLTGSTPGMEAGSVPPPWSPSNGATTQPSPDPEPQWGEDQTQWGEGATQWGEDQPQWGDQPPTTDQPAPPTPFTAPTNPAPPLFSEPTHHQPPPASGHSPTQPGTHLFGDQDPHAAHTSTDTAGESGPFGTTRPGEFGLPSAPERPPEPKVVRPSVIPGSDKPSRGNGSGPSRTLIWSGVAAAVLLVLAGGWYFLLRDDGSDEEAAKSVKPTVAAETTVSTEQQPSSTTEPLPTKPTIAPGERLPPLEFSGTGDSTVVVDPPGPRVARVDYTGTGPFVLKGLDANGGEVATLVESDGPYSGSVAVDFHDEQDSRSLSIEGAGSWSIRMVPVESLIALPGQFKGSGDNVVLYTGGIGPVALSHSGTGPFKVNYFEVRTRKITTIADENGPFEGTAELRGPAFVWITADGLWSVTPG